MERTRDSSDKQALASASGTMLTTKNFPEWKVFIEEKATGHRKAGQALRSGRPVNLREPERDDKRNRTTKVVISEGDYVAELNLRIGHLDPDGDNELIADIEAVLEAEYQQAYLNEFAFESAVKKFFREQEAHEEDGPELYGFMLRTMGREPKEAVRADIEFRKADQATDYMKLWEIVHKIYARQGMYSSLAARTRFMGLTMIGNDMSFNRFVSEYNELIRIQTSLGIPLDPVNNSLQFLTRVRMDDEIIGWNEKIHSLLSTDPTPSLDVCVDALLAQMQLNAILTANEKVEPRPTGTKPRADPLVLSSTNENNHMRKVRSNCTCMNCGKNGHKGSECRMPKATCEWCKRIGHRTEQHDLAMRIEHIESKDEKRGEKVGVGIAQVDDWDEEEATASYLVL